MLYFDKIFDFDKRLEEINGMTYDDTREVIEGMFNEKQKAIALVGRAKKAFPLT